jgi:hypothetical protein
MVDRRSRISECRLRVPPPEPISAADQFEFVRDNALRVFPRDRMCLDHVVTFAMGFDMATGYTAFKGFQMWLVVRLGDGYEYHWSALAKTLALRGSLPPKRTELTKEEDHEAAKRLLDIIVEFLHASNDMDDVRRVCRDFDRLRASHGLPREVWSGR